MQQQQGRPTPIAPSNSTSLPALHGFSVSTAAMLAGQPKVTSIPSYLPTHPHRDPSAPAYPVYPDHSKEYHKQIPSPYQAGAASRPQQYAGNPNYPQPGGGGASGVVSGSGTGGGGGPGSRGPYQKRGPGPFAVPLKQMMFGFGDEPDAPEDTVAVMEDLLGHFVQELCSLPPLSSTHPSLLSLKPRTITSHTLRSNLSPHPLSTPLLSRLQELTVLQKDVNQAKKPFDAKADDLAKGSGAVLYNEEGNEVVVKKRKRGTAVGGAEKKRNKKKKALEEAEAGLSGGAGGGGGGEGEVVVKEKKKIGRPKTVPGSNKGAGPSI